MRRILTICLAGVAAAAVLHCSAAAEDDAPQDRGARARALLFRRFGGAEGVLKQFDANNNGRIDGEEQAKIREFVQQQMRVGGAAPQRPGQSLDRGELLKRFDANGNGQLEPEERAKAMAAFRARMRPGGAKRPDGAKRPGDAKPGAPGRAMNLDRLPPQVKQRLLQRFDKNNNGELDPPELAMVRQSFQGGGRGRGVNQPFVPGKPPQATLDRSGLLKRFDANSNGKLDPQERAKAIRDLP